MREKPKLLLLSFLSLFLVLSFSTTTRTTLVAAVATTPIPTIEPIATPTLESAKEIPVSESNPAWEQAQEQQYYANLAAQKTKTVTNPTPTVAPITRYAVSSQATPTPTTLQDKSTKVAGVSTQPMTSSAIAIKKDNSNLAIDYIIAAVVLVAATFTTWRIKRRFNR